MFSEFNNESVNVFYALDSRCHYEGKHYAITDTTIINVRGIKMRYDELIINSCPKTKMWSNLSVDNFINAALLNELAHHMLLVKYNFNSETTNINWTKYSQENKLFQATSSRSANEFISDANSFSGEPLVMLVMCVRRYVFRELSSRLKEYQKEQGFALTQEDSYDEINKFFIEQMTNSYPQNDLDAKFDVWANEFKKIPIESDAIKDFMAEKIRVILSGINQNNLLDIQRSFEREALRLLNTIKNMR